MALDWDDYRYFLAVAESGSLSAAAQRLNVAQPTVGRRIKALEQRLGVRLFERLVHGYVLTSAGAEIQTLAVNMEQHALAIERHVAGRDHRLAGAISIATTEALAVHWLVPKLTALVQRHPELQPSLVTGTATADLLRREADIALRIGDPGNDALIGRRVGQIDFGLYAAPSYLTRFGEPHSLQALAGDGHKMIESIRELADLRQAQLLRQHVATVALSCNSLLVQLAAASAGIGLLALPGYVQPERYGLRRVLTKQFAIRLELWLLTHRDLRDNARVRAVLDFLADAVHQEAELFWQ